jgi:hypothetical protein
LFYVLNRASLLKIKQKVGTSQIKLFIINMWFNLKIVLKETNSHKIVLKGGHTSKYAVWLTNVQHNKFAFSKIDFVLLTLIIEWINLSSRLKVRTLPIYYLSSVSTF